MVAGPRLEPPLARGRASGGFGCALDAARALAMEAPTRYGRGDHRRPKDRRLTTSPPSSPDAPVARRAILGIVAMAAVFGVQQGVSYPLLALILEAEGHAGTVIGLNAAMLPVGVIAAVPLIAPLAKRLGGVRLALACCAVLVGALAVLMATRDLAVWFAARFFLGMAINGLYVLSETWLNLLVPPTRRGRWLAVYATAVGAGFAIGPALLLATGTAGSAPFVLTIAITLATAGLVLVAAPRLPAIAVETGHSLRAFLPLAPLLLLAVCGAAAFDQAVLTFLPLYMLGIGAGADAAKLAITALALGNVLLQVPIGWLADRVSRRAAMRTCTTLTLAGALVLPLVATPGPALWLLVFLWGGLAYGVYTVALIELGDRFTGGLLLAGNAAFALMWGVAGLVGPAATGVAMDLAGPQGLPAVLGLLFAGIALAFWRRPARLDRPATVA